MMSKRIGRFLALVTIFTLATLALPAKRTRNAAAIGQPQRTVVSSSATRNAAIVAATSEVLKETSEIRELSILRPVKSSAQSRT